MSHEYQKPIIEINLKLLAAFNQSPQIAAEVQAA